MKRKQSNNELDRWTLSVAWRIVKYLLGLSFAINAPTWMNEFLEQEISTRSITFGFIAVALALVVGILLIISALRGLERATYQKLLLITGGIFLALPFALSLASPLSLFTGAGFLIAGMRYIPKRKPQMKLPDEHVPPIAQNMNPQEQKASTEGKQNLKKQRSNTIRQLRQRFCRGVRGPASRFILISAAISFVVFEIWWMQIRPASIKKECSWKEMHNDAVHEITQAQADKEREACLERLARGFKSPFNDDINRRFGEAKCNSIRPQPSQPEKTWYEPAGDVEYKRCLHNNGL
ncbi:MAG: hypothetical protein Q7S96_04100 [bacterium]|nr:hypothetical protein [bacterium]